MDSNRSVRPRHSDAGFFSLCDPWESLTPEQRGRRVMRIFMGCGLLAFFLGIAVIGLRGVFLCRDLDQAVPILITEPLLLLLAWAVGRMFIWRRVRARPLPPFPPPPRPPRSRPDYDPPDPADDDPSGPPWDAPRPAPLRPFSPRILSAAAELTEE